MIDLDKWHEMIRLIELEEWQGTKLLREFLRTQTVDDLTPLLLDMLKSDSVGLQAEAISGLMRIDAVDDNTILNLVLNMADSPNNSVRRSLYYEWAGWGFPAFNKAAMDKIMPKIYEEKGNELYWAIAALAHVGDQTILPALEWVRDNDDSTNYEGMPNRWFAERHIKEIKENFGIE